MKRCPFCNKKLVFGDKMVVGEKQFYDVCKHCSGGTFSGIIKNDKVEKIYQSEGYFKGLSTPQENKLLQWFLTRRIYETPTEWIVKKFMPTRILDVGCGNGEFLDELQKRKFRVYGIDISRVAVRNTAKKIGEDKVVNGNFLKHKFRNRFNLISFWHVLEHINKPASYLERSASLLDKGGLIVGEVPNFGSPLLHVFRKNYAWIIIPEHLIYFSEGSLKMLLRRTGFKSIKISYPPRGILNFSFSLEKSLRKKNLSQMLNKSVVILSIPISILLGYLFSRVGKGEVLRFSAKK